jgi:hypothetical protein
MLRCTSYTWETIHIKPWNGNVKHIRIYSTMFLGRRYVLKPSKWYRAQHCNSSSWQVAWMDPHVHTAQQPVSS